MSKYLVIGGNGIIGHFLTRQLVEQGHRPVVMSRSGDRALIRDVANRCDIASGDIADAAALEDIVRSREITHIAHLGAVLPNVSETNPALGMRINAEGTANVLAAALKNGVARVVMTSSKAVYGAASGRYGHPHYEPMPEDKAPQPVTVYGIGKLASEHLGRWYAAKHGLQFAALRCGSTVGPGKISRHGGSFSRLSLILESAMAGKPLDVPSGGDALCDTIFNDDVARGIVCALQVPELKHDVFNIATGTGITLNDYAAAVKRVYPDARISIGPGFSIGSTQDFVLDARRAREDLGFVADPDLDHMVERYIATMKRLGLAPAA